MRAGTIFMFALLVGSMGLSACAPLIGAGAVVAADKVEEDKTGGDGLF